MRTRREYSMNFLRRIQGKFIETLVNQKSLLKSCTGGNTISFQRGTEKRSYKNSTKLTRPRRKMSRKVRADPLLRPKLPQVRK